MKYQIYVLKQLFKHNYYKIFFSIFFFLATLILLEFLKDEEITQKSLYTLIGIIYNYDASFLEYLWIAFQMGCMVYILYVFMMYEENNSLEFTFLRTRTSNILKNKIIIFLIFLILFRILIYLIVISIFNKYLKFTLLSFCYNILTYIIVALISSLCYIFYTKKKDNLK